MQRTETPICMGCSRCRRTDEADSPSMEPCVSQQAIAQRTFDTRTGADRTTLSFKGERRKKRGEIVANAFCTFKGDRVRMTESSCVELNLNNSASRTVLDILSTATVDPHETRQAAATRMSHEQCEVDMPVILLQLDEGCYRGPSVSSSARRVIAVEAREFYTMAPVLATIWKLPLVPAHDSIVHKMQLLTIPRILVDGKRFLAAPSWYVSFSQVKEQSHLALAHPLTWRDL